MRRMSFVKQITAVVAAGVCFSIPELLCAQAGVSARVQAGPVQRADPPALLLGAAWYPEQWPEARWNTDLDLMQKAHMHMVRVGKFAWRR